jgi:hypothetical protein
MDDPLASGMEKCRQHASCVTQLGCKLAQSLLIDGRGSLNLARTVTLPPIHDGMHAKNCAKCARESKTYTHSTQHTSTYPCCRQLDMTRMN